MARQRILELEISVEHNYDTYINYVHRIASKSLDFSQVVLEGINEMQKWQRRLAPRGSGPGPHGRIPKSIKAARIIQKGDIVTGISRTDYIPAIVTAEGSGKHGPRGQAYPISRGGRTWYHPGVKGTNWWDEGAIKGESIALRSFRRKVEDYLDIRGVA